MDIHLVIDGMEYDEFTIVGVFLGRERAVEYMSYLAEVDYPQKYGRRYEKSRNDRYFHSPTGLYLEIETHTIQDADEGVG